MKKTVFSASVMAILALVLWCNGSLLAQDKYILKAPNGILFSEIRGYET